MPAVRQEVSTEVLGSRIFVIDRFNNSGDNTNNLMIQCLTAMRLYS
jgi:hypothetical protein